MLRHIIIKSNYLSLPSLHSGRIVRWRKRFRLLAGKFDGLFEGKLDQNESLKHWFETVAPIPKNPDVGQPVWQGRLDDQPDIYLIIPGSGDMGIKWREGEFQIKGRVFRLSALKFSVGDIRVRLNAG